MPEQINLALREHTTSIGFQLTLSKAMIDTLVALDHFKGDHGARVGWEYEPADSDKAEFRRRRALFSHYVVTVGSLQRRGLMEIVVKYDKAQHVDVEKSRHKLTRAGRTVVSLLKQAGIYQERIKEMGLQ